MNKIFTIFIILFSVNIYAISLEERLINPQTQKDAIKELWEMKETGIPKLKELLKSNNKELREIALVRIIYIKDNTFVSEVMEILNKDDEIRLRKRAIQYFCAVKERSVIPILQEKALKAKEEKEKLYAIEAMVYIIAPEDNKEYAEVIKTLKEALKDEDGLVRMEAGYGLAKLDEDSGYEVAVKDLNNENALVRERAVEVIGEIGKSDSMPLIETALKDGEIWVRTKAKIAKEKVELVKESESQSVKESGVKEEIMKKMSRKAMLADKPAMKQKIEKLRKILNAEDKILDIKIWAANEMLDMGEEGLRIAEEMIKNNEAGAYVMGKEMAGRRKK